MLSLLFLLIYSLELGLCVYSLMNAIKYKQKGTKIITLIMFIIIIFINMVFVLNYYLDNVFLHLKHPRNIYYILEIFCYFITISLTIINIVYLIVTRKNKTLSPNKINKSIPVCPKCNMPVSQNKNFCKNCGERINTI